MTSPRPSALAALLLLGAGLTAPGAHATSPAPAPTILDGVTVGDVRTGALARNREILIEGGRITRIVRAHTLKPASGATVVAAPGKFVTPGYLDMHAHSLNSPAPQPGLQLMLAYGITGFRQMSGTPALLEARREGKLPIPEASPALLATPGNVLAGGAAVPAPAMVAEVDRQKAQGADFIKVVDLGAPAFFAALDEAKKDGLPFARPPHQQGGRARGGVKMMTGADAGSQWLVPGASLHQEFDLTAQVGVPPLHVLQMATLNGALFLQREADMGTVEPGKAADLAVLDADPTASVQNMRRINAVVRAGRYYSRAEPWAAAPPDASGRRGR